MCLYKNWHFLKFQTLDSFSRKLFAFNVVFIHTKTCQGNENENVIFLLEIPLNKAIRFFRIYRFYREPFIEKTIKNFLLNLSINFSIKTPSTVNATLIRCVALRFSTVNATLLISRFFFKFQKSNCNDVAEHKNCFHLKLQTLFVLCNTTIMLQPQCNVPLSLSPVLSSISSYLLYRGQFPDNL